MKKFFGFLAVFILFLFAVVNALLLLPPTTYARQLIVEGVKEASGLDLKFTGPMSLRLVPSLNLRMENVTLINPAAAPGAAPLITARAVEVRSDFLPLVRGERNIERIRIIEPSIEVAVDKAGRPSWLAAGPVAGGSPPPTATATPSGGATPEGSTPSRAPASPASPATGPATTPASTSRPSVAGIYLVGARIVYRDARDGTVAILDNADVTVKAVTAESFAEAVISAAAASWQQGSGGALKLTEAGATVREYAGGRIAEVSGTGSTLQWRDERTRTQIDMVQAAGKASAIGVDGIGPLVVSGTSLTWRPPGGSDTLTMTGPAGEARSFKAGQLGDVSFKSGAVVYGTISRGGPPPPMSIEYMTAKAPVLALGAPVDAAVSFVWNKERVAGQIKVPAPETLAAGGDLPAVVSLATSKGSVDLDGRFSAAEQGGFKGRTKLVTPSLDGLAAWLGAGVPKTLAGPASMTGDVDARPNRFALSNGRIEHGASAMTGSLTVDTSGARPALMGTLAADKLDADHYLGMPAPKRAATRAPAPPGPATVTPDVSVVDALKAYMQAALDAPIRRGGGLDVFDVAIEQMNAKPASSSPSSSHASSSKPAPKRPTQDVVWSEDKIDLSALKTVDLDLNMSVKSLKVRGFDVAVPHIKTVLKDGALSLEGQNLATRGGRVSGKAEIDARQSVPFVSTSFKADGIDVYDLMEAIGVDPVISGSSTVEGNLTGNGSSQRQLVQTLSGQVKTRMSQGTLVGYDFSSVLAWIFGPRPYDPSQRTPFTRLDANVMIDNGVARQSNVQMDGPIIGVEADGSIKLIEEEIDYRARLRLSSILRSLSLRVFGDWSKPNVAPDLNSVFNRSPASELNPIDALNSFDLTDPELASMTARVLEKAGPRLDPAVAANLKTIQQRASGIR